MCTTEVFRSSICQIIKSSICSNRLSTLCDVVLLYCVARYLRLLNDLALHDRSDVLVAFFLSDVVSTHSAGIQHSIVCSLEHRHVHMSATFG